jgi:hypothetical protein
MQALMQTDVGFDRDRLLVARMDVRSMGYTNDRRQARRSGAPAASRDSRRGSASASLNGPLGTSWRASSLIVEGYTPAPNEQLLTNQEFVTADYFGDRRLALSKAALTPDDARPGSRNTIVNQAMARRFFPAGGAVGKRWTSDDSLQPDSPVIVGVVQDAKYVNLRGATPNMIYRLAGSAPAEVLDNLEIRTSGAPSALAPTVRQALSELEPALAVFDIVPLDRRVTRGLVNDRLIASLTSAFSIVRAAARVSGVAWNDPYGVARRSSELGLRMALGAVAPRWRGWSCAKPSRSSGLAPRSDFRWPLSPAAVSCRCSTAWALWIRRRTRRRPSCC